MNSNLIIIDTYRQKYEACALLKSLGYTEINANGGTYPCILIVDKDRKTVSEKPVTRFEEPQGNYSLKALRKEAKTNRAKSLQLIKDGMKLIETPQSIVPEQSEIDSWPQLKRTSHQDGCAHHPLKCCECLLKEIDDEYLNHTPFDEEKHLKNADEAKFYAAYLEATRYAP